jgi:imidazolonepropionase-like amidohydrolase
MTTSKGLGISIKYGDHSRERDRGRGTRPPAKDGGTRPRQRGAKRAILAGIDSIEHGTFLEDETLDLMKARGTYLVPTLIAAESMKERIDKGLYLPPAIEAKTKAALAAKTKMSQHAAAKGVKIGFGTDAGVYAHGRNAGEFHLMVDQGAMKPIDALRSAASADAELLGLAGEIGTLEAGKLADVVAVPGDPVENIRQTEHVFFCNERRRDL